jgi:uncharacterized protein YyaL (SSP411 family)
MSVAPRWSRRGRWVARISCLALLAGALSAGAEAVAPALPEAPAFPDDLRGRLTAAVESRPKGWEARTRHRRPDGSPLYTNRLALETSPYLRQHAHNPVNWYPWGDEAFAAAKKLGRPVFVSIGYSTCHWCHVMEEESFDDLETAKLMNAHFVAIKVDREARPDVDAIYMRAVHTLGQQGGWPLNVWLTPDRKPFYGGTYFPPEDSRGRPGFKRLLTSLSQVWNDDRERITRQADALATAVNEALTVAPATSTRLPPASLLREALEAYRAGFDPESGGLRGRVKFPATFPVRLLLRAHRRTGDEGALQMSLFTLEKLAAGGIHDQIGGGFHRYSTDPTWLVPHFEKMLYDNALLAMAYLEAWQVTGREDLAAVVRDILTYVARDMTDPRGGFYSATDADSEGPDGEVEEGRFFTWTSDEIDAALGAGEGALVRDWFGVGAPGQLEGRSILHRAHTAAEVAQRHGIEESVLAERIERARVRLRAARAERPAPHRDEKILAAWNGLMISAFARAGFAFDDPSLTRRAEAAAGFVLETMRGEGRLHRVSKDGVAGGPAFLEDYAFVIAGLLDLYEAASDPRWIAEAVALQGVLDAHFLDAENGGYFRTAKDQDVLIAREKPAIDGALPSGNAVAAMNLIRLSAFTGDEAYSERAFAIFSAFYDAIVGEVTQVSEMLMALDFALEPGKEVLVVGPEGAADLGPMLALLRETYVPNRILAAVRQGAELQAHAKEIPLLKHKKARRGEVTAYVCVNRVCQFPTADPQVFREQITQVPELPTSD